MEKKERGEGIEGEMKRKNRVRERSEVQRKETK